MRKMFWVFILMLAAGMILTGSVNAAKSDPPRIILFTYYRQMGWGDRVQIGWVDEDGAVRLITGHDSELQWPYKPEEQLAYLAKAEKFTEKDHVKHSDLFPVESLIYSVEDQGSRSVPAANDAGTEKSYAVNYTREGEAVITLLGMSGDDMFENTDADAQALYLRLRQLFPEVTSYAYGPMGPQGFVPVPFSEFTGLTEEIVKDAEIHGYLSDCEEGPIPMELTDDDKAELIGLIRDGVVTGKADCVESTGGFYVYNFLHPDGGWIAGLMFEDGLLKAPDGRYFIERRNKK